MGGSVVFAGEPGFEAVGAGYQTRRRHRPDVVVTAANAEDVVTAVEFAAARDVPVAVQCTGHALAAVAGEGGVLIDTSRMNGFRIDPAERTVHLAAGVRWGAVIRRAARYGLAPLSGSAPDIAAVPYTLGGGLGLLARQFGYAADLVRELDVVTPDGRRRRVTATRDADLFWALRGGRDNFGVVVGMEMALLPVRSLYGGGLYFAPTSAEQVFHHYCEWTRRVPPELSSSLALVSLPDVPAVAEPLRGRRVVHLRLAYNGPPGEGRELIAGFRAIGPLLDTVAEMPFTASASIYNEPGPGAFEATNILLGPIGDDLIGRLLDTAGPAADLPNMVELHHLGGRLAEPPVIGSAVGYRDAEFLLLMASRGDERRLDAARSAHRELVESMWPWWTGGRCLNFLTCDADPEMVRSCYAAADYQRLRQIKARVDPRNLFRHNHNIPPVGNFRAARNLPPVASGAADG
ncbi:FAD-binding oxidoreductase [Nocardia nova]|uniref:FAD-binding oxidoreductase n=1 Tax=Nocardia nova TaxID=37330 RepID=UPI00046CAB78|nr:FAD-binding oxidoreductase [Nocardia nova]